MFMRCSYVECIIRLTVGKGVNAVAVTQWKLKMLEGSIKNNIRIDFIESFETEETIRGKNWEPHAHTGMHEIGIYLCGEVNVRHGDDLYTPLSGDVNFYLPDELHCGVILKPCLVGRVNIFIPEETAEAYAADGFDLLAFCRDAGEHGRPHVLRLPSDALQEMMHLVSEMRDAIDRSVLNADAIVYSNFIKLFTIFNAVYFSDSMEHLVPPPTGMIREACEYIDAHYGEIENLSEVADAIHVNGAYLSSVFKRRMNIAMSDYLNYRRLSRSRYFLAAGKSVTEACFEAGFSSMSYYIKLFRKLYGITPGVYAEQIKVRLL